MVELECLDGGAVGVATGGLAGRLPERSDECAGGAVADEMGDVGDRAAIGEVDERGADAGVGTPFGEGETGFGGEAT